MRAADLTPGMLLRGYARGIFPMAERRDADEVFWVDPRRRAVVPLEGFHASRSLRRRIRTAPWQIEADRDFAAVVAACADREETWISPAIAAAYGALHAAGFAHSLEVREGSELIGGVYGVALGAAFFAESMFSRRTDASKVALAHLIHRLRSRGFRLFDVQFQTPHLASLGAVEISRGEYLRRLAEALEARADFGPPGPGAQPSEVLHAISQTS